MRKKMKRKTPFWDAFRVLSDYVRNNIGEPSDVRDAIKFMRTAPKVRAGINLAKEAEEKLNGTQSSTV